LLSFVKKGGELALFYVHEIYIFRRLDNLRKKEINMSLSINRVSPLQVNPCNSRKIGFGEGVDTLIPEPSLEERVAKLEKKSGLQNDFNENTISAWESILEGYPKALKYNVKYCKDVCNELDKLA